LYLKLQTSILFCIETDNLYFAIGVILSQISADNSKWYLVVYFSKFLSSIKYRYKIYNKKWITQSLKEWCHFLEDTETLVEIWTNYKNLEYFMTAKKLNCKQAQWSLYLARFNFMLYFKPRKFMDKPDILSC